MYSVPWPLNRSKGGSGLVLLQTFLLSCFETMPHMSVVAVYVCLCLCGFVALCIRMSVAGANKFEGNMS